MLSLFKKYLVQSYADAVHMNYKNIMDLLEINTHAKLLDLGCNDGVLTTRLAKKISTQNIFGVDIVDEQIKIARHNGVEVSKFNLNENFLYDSDFFDVIHANQVIEHITDSDSFLEQLHRVLKSGGYAIISTENASSWCNIAASILGWQIFSLTNFSNKALGIGNPLSLHKNSTDFLASWLHVRIYNIRGLIEYFEISGFKVEKILGAGYFPLPTIFAKFDTTHSHFITFKIRKI